MNGVVFLALRRLRLPLLLLIAVYALGVAGLVLIPGIDSAGRPAHLSFFHAFYFLTYTASTIGFGEIPYEYTDPQRLWVTIVIYLSVIGWAYTVAAVLALARDSSFRLAVVTTAFRRRVQGLGEPFYVVCGYGETGTLVCQGLSQMGLRFVVLDVDEKRIDELELNGYRAEVPALRADARLPENLIRAGIRYPNCLGVLALTNDDDANLAVAITVRLLNPRIPVLCRATRDAVGASMSSFDTDHIINPFREFSDRLWDALHAPARHALVLRLTGLAGAVQAARQSPPRGQWIICGYGRFGREVVSALLREGLSMSIIDPDPPSSESHQFVRGLGTDAPTLLEAGVANAVGIVAGTDDDINNLCIAMTARALNPDLFVVMRQNLQANHALFRVFRADMVMVPAEIIANECLALIATPLLDRFLKVAAGQTEDWAAAVDARLREVVGDTVPSIWPVAIDGQQAPALIAAPRTPAQRPPLAALVRDPSERDRDLQCVPLLLVRAAELVPLPAIDTPLAPGDALLFAGTVEARSRQALTLRDVRVYDYVQLGIDAPDGWVWQWLNRRRAARAVRGG